MTASLPSFSGCPKPIGSRQRDGIPGHEGGSQQTLHGMVILKGPTPSKNALVGHYIFDSGTEICFPPMVFALTFKGVISYLWATQ
jgi:hypothetical protein